VEEINVKSDKGNQVIKVVIFVKKRATEAWRPFLNSSLFKPDFNQRPNSSTPRHSKDHNKKAHTSNNHTE
jgi:hypothetical protein